MLEIIQNKLCNFKVNINSRQLISFGFGSGLWCLTSLSTIFQLQMYIMEVGLLVEVTQIPGENHQSAVSHWQTYHIMFYRVPLAMSGFRTYNFSDDI